MVISHRRSILTSPLAVLFFGQGGFGAFSFDHFFRELVRPPGDAVPVFVRLSGGIALLDLIEHFEPVDEHASSSSPASGRG